MSRPFSLTTCLLIICSSVSQIRPQSLLTIKEQEPNGIHLVYGADPSSQVQVVWWTQVPITSALVYYSLIDEKDERLPIELIGCNNDRMEKGYLARNATMTKYVHRVMLKNLLPNRRYCYEITSGHASSHIYAFRTAALSIEIGIKSKYQTENGFHANFLFNSQFNSQTKDKAKLESIKYQMNNKQINGFINLSPMNDLSYLRPNESDFLDIYMNVLSNMAVMPTCQHLDANSQINSLFGELFPLMGQISFNSNMYSLDSYGVHFLTYSLPDEYNEAKLNSLMKWLEQDLMRANKNRHLVPWIVAYLPMASLDLLDETDKRDFYVRQIETMLYEYDVDLVISMADGRYERTYPFVRSINKVKTDFERAEMPVRVFMPRKTAENVSHHVQEWTAFKLDWKASMAEHSYGLLEVINSTALRWSYVDSRNDSPLDTFLFEKDHNGVYERIYRQRQHFIQTIVDGGSTADVHHQPTKLLFVIVSITLLIVLFILFLYTYIKRYLVYQKQLKIIINSNYSNLIESEFDI